MRGIRWREVLLTMGLFAVFFAAMALVQFSTPDMPDNDGYYHIKMAQLMRTEGIKPVFRYLPLTILNEREFYDHHFLFHIALIPFTFGDLRLGAKWAAAFFAALALLSIWWLFRSQKIPYAWLWALGALAVSDAFLFRMSITRAQSLSLAVLVLGLHWMLTGKYTWLLPLSFFYVWMYNAFPLLPIIAGLFTVAVLMIERRFEWRPLAYATIGVVLGLLINPYFPVNVVFIYRHILPKLADATATRVGNEWYPYNTLHILENSMFSLVAFAAGTLALGLNNRRMDTRTAMSLFMALMTGLMLFQSRRFIEYFPAFALIFAAFAWAPLMEEVEEDRKNRVRYLMSRFPVFVLVVCVAAGAIIGLPAVAETLRDSKPYRTYSGASQWLIENTDPGERVFQTDWDDFPRLFFYNTENTYLIGLDPTYMQLYDPELYDRWVDITQGRVDDLSESIVSDFGAHYVHSDLDHKEFITAAVQDPEMDEVYRDSDSVIFKIQE